MFTNITNKILAPHRRHEAEREAAAAAYAQKHALDGQGMPVASSGTVYRGLNQPYTGATQHPTYGYTRLTSDQKSQRYLAKATEWERRGDLTKAQKNREKANRYRMRNQSGYTKPIRSQDYYSNRALNFDQKALRYQQLGRNDSALRSQQRAQRIRAKHNIALMSAPLGKAPLATTGLSTSTHIVDEGVVERQTIIKDAIVDERVRVDTLVEVQPILHRDIDQSIVHHVEQHVVEPTAAFVGGTVTNQPIIQETVITKVVDEIQPIVHREIAVPRVEKVEEHLSERLVEPTVHTHEVKQGRDFDRGAIIKPAIVDETTRVDTLREIQPVIHREVERLVINHVEQHIVEPAAPFVGGTVRKEQLVDEKVRTNEVEEITPIVHREIAVPRLEKVEEHLQERAVAPTQHTHGISTVAGLASGVTHDKNAIVKPVIMDEHTRQDTVVEIQPIVHREIEKPVVHHVEQHIREAPAPFVGGTYTNQPIVEEHLKTKVVDEIQPVVHKEKALLQVEQREEHFAQHIVAPTQHTNEMANLRGHVSDITLHQNTIVKPEVLQETIRQDTFTEIQPVVHREISQPVVHHIEEHIQEPAALNVGGTFRNQAIIDERIINPVVEEIQPVVHREIAVPQLEKVEEHLGQKVVLPTQHTQSVAQTINAPASSASFAQTSVLAKAGEPGHVGLKQRVETKIDEKRMERDEKRAAGQAL